MLKRYKKIKIISNYNLKRVIMGPGPRFEPESRDPQSRRITTYPTPAHLIKLN